MCHDDAVADLEVRRASLEDTYMAMIHHRESGGPQTALAQFTEMAR